MAEIVFQSTQYLSNDDALAMATYLSLCRSRAAWRSNRHRETGARVAHGSSGSRQRALQGALPSCHGKDGEGGGAYPALAGNRTVPDGEHDEICIAWCSPAVSPRQTAATRSRNGMPPFYPR